MNQQDAGSFAGKYGGWALVAGASEGVGLALAEAIAERGVNVVLLARRQAVLDEVAAGISARTGVETRTLAIDLATAGAHSAIVDATEGLDIGLLVYCAGADADYVPFLANTIDAAEGMLQRNCLVPMKLCHHFAAAMVARGRGGVVIFGSGAGFVGAPNMTAYAATKAFDMIFAESLWSELKPQGVDVLGVILGETDTPALRRLRHARGLAGPDEVVVKAATVDEVVSETLKHLSKGPTLMAGKQIRRAARLLYPIPRSVMVRMAAKAGARTMGKDPTGP